MKVFTTGQVAKICKVAPRTVSKWFDSGRLKGYRIPGSQDRRIPREQLIRFLKEHGMPLGELEEEEWHNVLVIGAEKLFIERLREILPEDEDYKYEIPRRDPAARLRLTRRTREAAGRAAPFISGSPLASPLNGPGPTPSCRSH